MSIRKLELSCRSSPQPVISNGVVNGAATNLGLLTPRNNTFRRAIRADDLPAGFLFWRQTDIGERARQVPFLTQSAPSAEGLGGGLFIRDSAVDWDKGLGAHRILHPGFCEPFCNATLYRQTQKA